MPRGSPAVEVPWIEPYPDSALEELADSSPGPAARYEMREAVRLAFIAATQRLPARQRAVLLLRDVLGWSAGETAQALKMTVASANSALQRARLTLEKRESKEEIVDRAAEQEADDNSPARPQPRCAGSKQKAMRQIPERGVPATTPEFAEARRRQRPVHQRVCR